MFSKQKQQNNKKKKNYSKFKNFKTVVKTSGTCQNKNCIGSKQFITKPNYINHMHHQVSFSLKFSGQLTGYGKWENF